MSKKKEQLPQAQYEGPLTIGDLTLDCAVLEDGTRVISERKFMSAMDIKRSGYQSKRRAINDAGAGLPLFLAAAALKPYVDKHFGPVLKEPIRFNTLNNAIAHGIEATTLPKICEVWIDAMRDGKLKGGQLQTGVKADMLLRGFANVGIIALVDEATGYQAARGRDALQQFLDKFLQAEARKWTKTFPDEFFEAIFTMKGWSWGRATMGKKPGVIGHYINNYVYARLGPGLLKQMRAQNPVSADTGRRSHMHHQHTTDDYGLPELKQRIRTLIDFAAAAGHNWTAWTRMVERAFPKFGDQLSLPYAEDKDPKD